MSRAVTYYFSLVSPWAYLGHAEFGRIAERRDLTVDYRPVALGKVFPETGGLPLAKRHPSRQRYRLMELLRWRDARDLPLVLKPKHWPFDCALADCVALAAARVGPQARAHDFIASAFRAVWVDEENLADAGLLARLLAESGFDADEIMAAARGADVVAAYESNCEKAFADGVFGSPSWVVEGEVFWGQDRLAMLEEMIASGRAPYTPG